MKIKYIKYEYFRVTFTHVEKNNQKRGLFKLEKLIDIIKEKPLGERAEKIGTEGSRLDEYLKQEDYIFLMFSRLKKSYFTKKGKIDAPLKNLDMEDDDYIGEEVCALYDPKLHVLMLQRNRDSLSPGGIEQYLNLMLSKVTEDNQNQIFLEPICTDDANYRAKKGNVIRKLQVRVADKDIDKINKKDLGLKNLVNAWSQYEAPYVDIVLLNGRFKDQKINKEPVHDLIDEISKNPELINKARLTIGDSGQPEIIDLLTDKATDFSPVSISEKIIEAREQLNHIKVWDFMLDIYHVGIGNKKRKLDIQRYIQKGG